MLAGLNTRSRLVSERGEFGFEAPDERIELPRHRPHGIRAAQVNAGAGEEAHGIVTAPGAQQ